MDSSKIFKRFKGYSFKQDCLLSYSSDIEISEQKSMNEELKISKVRMIIENKKENFKYLKYKNEVKCNLNFIQKNLLEDFFEEKFHFSKNIVCEKEVIYYLGFIYV